MNTDSASIAKMRDLDDTRPILIVPYMWIGDFVRGHTVVRSRKQRWPNRPVDLLATSLCAPLVDYMPGVRSGIVWDLPRSRLAVANQWGLAGQLHAGNYGTALIPPPHRKTAIAPALAGIPERVGFLGEARFGLINRIRWGEKALPRFIDKNAALALPEGAALPPEWPVPQLAVPPEEGGRRGGGEPLAAGPGAGNRSRGGLGAGFGRRLEALDLLSASRAAIGGTWLRRLGGRRSRRKAAGTGDRGCRRGTGPRPHRR